MNENSRCPIWDTPASEAPASRRDGRLMDSRRAGGRYSISGTAIACLPKGDERLKARLTSWLINQRRSGDESGNDSTTVEQAKQRQDLPVHERADRFSNTLEVKPRRSEKLFGTHAKVFDPMLAWSESVDMSEVRYRYLEDQG